MRTIAFYYGPGALERLAGFDIVVLQPGHYRSEELEELRARGTSTLAYLSLGQDAGPPMPWHTDAANPTWGTTYVDVGHPGWIRRCVGEANNALSKGFAGLFLDTLDMIDTSARCRREMLHLIGEIRTVSGEAYLLANRGFDLFPELPQYIQGVVFESFSCTWTPENDLCMVLAKENLELNSEIARRLTAYDMELFALDYVHNHQQAAFVRTRALLHGMSWTIGNRSLTSIPEFRASLGLAEAGLPA